MYKVDLPIDQSIENAVERRRSAETERKARIFNTRLRSEEKNQQNIEIQRDKAFDKLREYHDEALLQQDIDEKEKQDTLQAELTQYWATHQRVEDSRDADLKCGLKGAFSSTTPEGKLGPASMTLFQGEDIGEEQRRREQMKKTDRNLRAQKEDNERKHVGEKQRDDREQRVGASGPEGVQLHALDEECKKATRIALDNYNHALTAERAERLKEQHRREEMEKRAEMQHTLTSDMMTECAEAAERELGGRRAARVLVDRWKGMSPEQLSAIHREREEQRQERERQRDAEKIQKAAWELQLLKLSRKAEEEDRRAEELRRDQRIQTDHYNMQLAREQQEHQEFLNKKLYTNKPSKDYFHQFNTSSR
ncbi:hypothetical protein F7725_000667 [Dissostichus mawsoni]|uniref:RIB43A-like with coiled-coils protein 1 n=1 Tax=Dissostichus mawsoni TaxID=36200 RepID=A0A7J5ZF32_DISMA|nr:hypothetical protein F7725_000667 [Dissostichus mawsoni]